MSCVWALLVVLILLQAEAAAHWLIGGHHSCGTWTAERRVNRTISWQLEAWVAGYLSGWATASSGNPLAGLEGDTIHRWIDDYCSRNPLEPISDAADALKIHLRKVSRNPAETEQ